MPTPSESPKKHVANSAVRQAKLAKEAKDKAEILARATELLSARVGTLADAVQINNSKIDKFQKELNRKPDDVEVQLITGMAEAERKRHFKWAIATAVLSSILAATIGAIAAYTVAQKHGQERCRVNDRNIAIIVSFLEGRIDPNDEFQPTIDALKANRNECT